MTEQLYYQDINQLEFSAHLISVDKDEKGWKVLLDRTCFFPEGGGQPPDKGWINKIRVCDVQKRGDAIYHYLEKELDPSHSQIQGKIDGNWRQDYMQQHMGQHIVSAAAMKIGEYQTVGIQFRDKVTTVELKTNVLTDDDLRAIENLANEVINKNLSARFIWTSDQELHTFPLRRPCQKKGNIRIIMIDDFDCAACTGLHFSSTGNVGLIKLVGKEPIRGNIRTHWKIGKRAYEDYYLKNTIVTALKPILTVGENMVVEKVKQLKAHVKTLERTVNARESQLADLLAENLAQPHQDQPVSVVTNMWKNESPGLVSKIMKNLLKREKTVICLVNIHNNKLLWNIGCSEDFKLDFSTIRKEILPLIKGKGGGNHPLWSGIGEDHEQILPFFYRFRVYIQSL